MVYLEGAGKGLGITRVEDAYQDVGQCSGREPGNARQIQQPFRYRCACVAKGIGKLGYTVVVIGQNGYRGIWILSQPILGRLNYIIQLLGRLKTLVMQHNAISQQTWVELRVIFLGWQN